MLTAGKHSCHSLGWNALWFIAVCLYLCTESVVGSTSETSRPPAHRRRFAYTHIYTADGRPMTLWVNLGARSTGKCGLLLKMKCNQMGARCHSSMNPGLLNKRSLSERDEDSAARKGLGRYLERVYAARRRHRARGKRTKSYKITCPVCSSRCWSQ